MWRKSFATDEGGGFINLEQQQSYDRGSSCPPSPMTDGSKSPCQIGYRVNDRCQLTVLMSQVCGTIIFSCYVSSVQRYIEGLDGN